MARTERARFPGVRYSPDGKESRVFEREEDVPAGWVDRPWKVGAPKPDDAKKPDEAKKGGRKRGRRKKEEAPATQDDEVLTREEAIEALRAAGVEVADDISDEDLEEALNALED